jgi:hypothetical protein
MAGYSEFRMEKWMKWMKLVSPGKSPKTVDFFFDAKW